MQRLVRLVLVLFGLFLVLGARPQAHGHPIQLTVSPHVAEAPATVRIDLRITPQSTDRVLEISTDSGAFFRQSSWSLQDGAKGQRLFTVVWPGLPPGDYKISVRLIRTDGVSSTADAMKILAH